MTKKLLEELIEQAEEMIERHLDDRYSCREMGSHDGELSCVKAERKTRSLVRRAKKALIQFEGD
jgi:hypothetical protein